MDKKCSNPVQCISHGGLVTRFRSTHAALSRGMLHKPALGTRPSHAYLDELHNTFDSAPVLGKGAFATVYDVGAGRCVKIERLDPVLSDKSLISPLATAIWAGGAGIAPRVHGWQVWRDSRVGDAVLVLEMDRINGSALGSWVLAEERSRPDVMRMSRRLQSCMLALGRVEVSHNDLHLFNVMVADCKVSGSPRPWLIDFTLSDVGRRTGVPANIHGCVVAQMWRAFETQGAPYAYAQDPASHPA